MGAGRAANRRLSAFVAADVVAGAACLVWSVVHVTRPASVLYVVVIVALVAVANRCAVALRFDGEPYQVMCTSAALLAAVAVLGEAWALFAVAAGMIIAQTTGRRRRPEQIAFNVSTELLGLWAAVSVVRWVGFGPALSIHEGLPSLRQIAALAIVAAVYAAVDDVLHKTVMTFATGGRFRTIIARDADIRTGLRLVNLALAIGAIALLDRRPDLILIFPLAIVTVQMALTQRLRRRTEERVAEHLALATADLASGDVTTVLHRAAHAALGLLSAAEAEIEAHLDSGVRLVRIHHDAVVYDGPALDAPPAEATSGIVIGEDVGRATALVRLRFKSPTTLSEREQDALRAFTFAVNNALSDAYVSQKVNWLPTGRGHAATHDPLTGLGNRRYLEEHATNLMLEPGLHAVALFDLNRFKHINDTLGHAAGDRLLVEIAGRLSRSVTGSDVVVRIGGDEFTVVFANLSAAAEGVRRIEMLLHAALNEPILLDGVPIAVEAAAGIAMGPTPGGLAELLRRADVAMYQAKRQGVRVCAYHPERDAARDLIATGQLAVTFQPVVALSTAGVTAARAAANWHRGRRHGINPQQLGLEHPSVLSAYNRHVLDRTLHAITVWRTAGYELPAVVQVTARSLLESDFSSDLAERLARAEVPPEQLTIEVSETVFHANISAANTTLRTLATMGVRLGLTDFGVTAMSLRTLARTRIHQLTIAAQLVGHHDTPTGAAIIRSILDLGRNLDLTVVADGVETEAQHATLRELGCATGQGPLFGDAMSPDGFLRRLGGIPRQRQPSDSNLRQPS
ncbi:MAG TPA: EAL domain-containing protein [Micromonosporaceae bacterium]